MAVYYRLMLTCITCGKVFREENHEALSKHDSVKHTHDYLGLDRYLFVGNDGEIVDYTHGFGWIINKNLD